MPGFALDADARSRRVVTTTRRFTRLCEESRECHLVGIEGIAS
jgi:hypothetical protein